jgi:isochorismate hydrolase
MEHWVSTADPGQNRTIYLLPNRTVLLTSDVRGSYFVGVEGGEEVGAVTTGDTHYLYHFCAEQTITVNTTAAGGNAALLAG